MADVTAVTRNLQTLEKRENIEKKLIEEAGSIKGRVVNQEEDFIELDFGSLLRSRLLGEFWVSRDTLPKRARIQLTISKHGMDINIAVVHTHRYGVMAGYKKKYQQALEETADRIVWLIKN